MKWSYKTVSKNILPTILLATWSTEDNTITEVDISKTENKKLFIFDWWTHNMPYEINNWIDPVTDWTDLEDLFKENTVNFWQNTSFRTCTEIKEAWKSIWDWEYQVLSSTWSLTNTGCTGM
jgi:hypothetical protein